MELRPGVAIKKDKDDGTHLFIIEDPNVTWVMQNNNSKLMELYCSIPLAYANEIVAIQIVPHDGKTIQKGYKMVGIVTGATIATGRQLLSSVVEKDILDLYLEECSITYNGAVYKLIK